jgi:diacylglycerol kinase
MINSFKNAFCGIFFAIRRERNMRIHITAAITVMFISLMFYEHSRAERVLLVLTCASVMSLELINTAIERLTDKLSPEQSPLAKAAKDCAAGAVLIAAIAAVIVGVILFL